MPNNTPQPKDPSEWGSVGYEEMVWEPRNSTSESGKPYLAAVPQKIHKRVPYLDTSLFAYVEEVSIDLVRFEQKLKNVNPGYQTLLTKLEALASSAIENEYSDLREIAIHELGKPGTAPSTLAVVGNIEALNFLSTPQTGEGASSRTDLIKEAHHKLLQTTAPAIAGRWREEPVWIGSGFSRSPLTASYVPPKSELIPELMEDLTNFGRPSWEIPGLVAIAITHGQFETIHPFADGNGRIGRAYAQSLIRCYDLGETSTLPMSVYLGNKHEQYVEALQAYRMGSIQEIVSLYVRAAESAINFSNTIINNFNLVIEGWYGMSTSREGSTAKRLLPLLVGNPMVNMRKVEKLLHVTPAAAYAGIQRLEKDGILIPVTQGNRNQAWETVHYFDTIDQLYLSGGYALGRRYPTR